MTQRIVFFVMLKDAGPSFCRVHDTFDDDARVGIA